ncbi:glycosyltransferase family 4 protein [Limnobacter sp.]|uniref:glycosyltransferase family 4 protein n=1 Tax=Limnobacter sp. TaxID=2003368 RepID=UPI0035138542
MNILITTPTFPPFNSGLGNAVRLQALMLGQCGVKVTIATHGERRETLLHPEGYSIERFAVTGANFLATPLKGDVCGYTQYLKQSRFDLILMNAWQNWAADIVLNNLRDIAGKKVMFSHGLATNILTSTNWFRSLARYVLWRPYAWRLKGILRTLDGFFVLAPDGCDSRFDDLRLAKRLKVPFHVIPNALPDYTLNSMPSNLPWEKRRGLIAIGAYHWTKGHDFVLRAYAKSQAKNRETLTFYGQSATVELRALERLANSLGIESKWVKFKEDLSSHELVPAYQNARLFLSGSHTECQPLTVLDSMALGTPFVARATGCLPLMAGGITVRSEQEMALEIDRLRDEVAFTKLANAGVAEAEHTHHPDQVKHRLWNSLKNVLRACGS